MNTKPHTSIAVDEALTDAELRASAVPVSVASMPLPAGAATAAKQDTGNASLASIDGKLTAPVGVTGPLTDAQLRAAPVPVSASFSVASAATKTNVTSAAIDTLIIAANASRKELVLYNDADKDVYVSLGTVAASLTSFTRKLFPQGDMAIAFAGQVRAIWDTGPTGDMRVTELT